MRMIDYVDVRKTAIAVLKDYHNQQYKIDHAAEEKARIDSSLVKITPSYSETGGGHGSGGNSVEARLANGMHKKEAIEHGYTEAQTYMAEFNAAWDQLTDEEQYILDVRFRDSNRDGVKRIMDRFFCERSEAYRKSDTALEHFARLLLW